MSELSSGETYIVSVPATPPSVNTMKGAHWAKAQKSKKHWEGMLFIALLEAKVPKKLARVHATATLTFPSLHRRDEGNFRAPLEKALGDALQLQWLADDTPDQFTFGELVFSDERGKAETRITLEVERAA